MPTIVAIHGRDATLTAEGWKTGDAQLDQICDLTMQTGAGGFHWDPNPDQAAAQKLAAAMDGKIVSVEAQASDDLPEGTIF